MENSRTNYKTSPLCFLHFACWYFTHFFFFSINFFAHVCCDALSITVRVFLSSRSTCRVGIIFRITGDHIKIGYIYGTHKNLYNFLLLLAMFGPIYYGPRNSNPYFAQTDTVRIFGKSIVPGIIYRRRYRVISSINNSGRVQYWV